ncbi:domesticated amidase effector 2-like [Tachypleus tridentatus]|uniref:domesticated amidase effector 2-like n=1 Tax=Tachypleus tridentatus TaxID=6853 RepID=UPI003FD56FF3
MTGFIALRTNLISTCLALLVLKTCNAFAECEDPKQFVGEWIGGKDSSLLLIEKCPKLTDTSPYFVWKIGTKVKENCREIPKWTAIATFLSFGNKYGGHSAIFESCDNTGIWVYDQRPATEPVERRKLIYTGPPVYNGDYYYTIEVE